MRPLVSRSAISCPVGPAVKHQFQNLDLQCWEGTGLGGSQPSLCLQADSAVADVLLAAIDELIASGPSSRRTLTLRKHARPKPIFTLRLGLVPESENLRQMSLTRDGDVAILEFTAKGLDEFRRAVVFWRDGGEDFSVHPHGSRKSRHLKMRDELGPKDLLSGELWFWTPRMDP